MKIEQETVAELHIGRGSVGTAAQQLTTLGLLAYKHVLVKSLLGNAGTIYIGHDINVTSSNGFPVAAGETVEIPIDVASKIYVIASTSAQGYAWMVI